MPVYMEQAGRPVGGWLHDCRALVRCRKGMSSRAFWLLMPLIAPRSECYCPVKPCCCASSLAVSMAVLPTF